MLTSDNLGKISVLSIPLDKSTDYNSWWISLKSESGYVEGKFYLSNKDRENLIIFQPGFPGGGSTQFEELWLKRILENGYSVFLIRHNGTLTEGKFSSNYLNCKERIDYAVKNKQKVLGCKDENNITDWLNEPLVASQQLSPHFSNIILCGHSFGPLALIQSLINFTEFDPENAKKICRVVSLSGSIGNFQSSNHPFLKVWYDHLNTEWARERVALGDAKLNTNIFYEAHKFITKNVNKFPSYVEFIAVVPWGDTQESTDEIVQPIESLDFISGLGRGYLIIDKKEYGDEKKGRMAHDMESLIGDDLANFVSKNWLPKSQISTLT